MGGGKGAGSGTERRSAVSVVILWVLSQQHRLLECAARLMCIFTQDDDDG